MTAKDVPDANIRVVRVNARMGEEVGMKTLTIGLMTSDDEYITVKEHIVEYLTSMLGYEEYIDFVL